MIASPAFYRWATALHRWQYPGYYYVCYPTYLGLYKILKVGPCFKFVDSIIGFRCVHYDYGYKEITQSHVTTAYISESAKGAAIWADEHHWTVQSCTFIGMKHVSPTLNCMYIIPVYLKLTTFTKTLSKCHLIYLFGSLYVALGLLHPWLCWLVERSQRSQTVSSCCPRHLQTCASLIHGRVPPPPPHPPPTQTNILATPVLLQNTVGRHLEGGQHGNTLDKLRL